jgi:hypothetical protein
LSATCVDPAGFGPVPGALLRRDGGLPSRPSTCDGVWSGPGGSREQSVYVRRSVETVLSTSAARALWASKSGLDATCTTVTLQNGPQTVNTDVYTPVRGGETWYGNGGNTLTLPFIVADANTFPSISSANAVGRLNPMAAGTTVTASSPTTGLVVRIGGGSPVPNTTEASAASVGVTFESASSGVVFVTFTSPSGLATTYTVFVTQSSASKPSSCP